MLLDWGNKILDLFAWYMFCKLNSPHKYELPHPKYERDAKVLSKLLTWLNDAIASTPGGTNYGHAQILFKTVCAPYSFGME